MKDQIWQSLLKWEGLPSKHCFVSLGPCAMVMRCKSLTNHLQNKTPKLHHNTGIVLSHCRVFWGKISWVCFISDGNSWMLKWKTKRNTNKDWKIKKFVFSFVKSRFKQRWSHSLIPVNWSSHRWRGYRVYSSSVSPTPQFLTSWLWQEPTKRRDNYLTLSNQACGLSLMLQWRQKHYTHNSMMWEEVTSSLWWRIRCGKTHNQEAWSWKHTAVITTLRFSYLHNLSDYTALIRLLREWIWFIY